jgi:hypothetical protein
MPSDDPYAKYLAPPAASSSSTGSDGADPYAKFLTKPGEAPAKSDVAEPKGYQYEPGFADQLVNAGTFRAPEYIEAGLNKVARATGINPDAPDIDQIRKRDSKYSEDHPILATGADMLGYAMGAGKFGAGERIAAGMGGGRIAQGIGSAIEGAGATGLGSLAAGDDVGTAVQNATGGALLSGALGTAIGVAGRELGPALGRASASARQDGIMSGIRDFRGPDNPAPAARSMDDLMADKQSAYGTLKGLPVSDTVVDNAVSKAVGSLTAGEQAGLSWPMRMQIKDTMQLIRDPSLKLTGDDLASFSANIRDAQRGGSDSIAGARIGEALRGIYAPEQALARKATARVGDAEWLDNTTPAKAPGEAAKRLADQKFIYSPDEQIAMQHLASFDSPMYRAPRAGLDWLAGKATNATAIGGVTGGVHGAITGLIAEQTAKAAHWALQRLLDRPIRRAIKGARASTSTGLPVTPDMTRNAPWITQGARQAVYGLGASGDNSS